MPRHSDFLTPVFTLFAVALFLFLPLATGYFIIQPLHERSRHVTVAIRRYSLLDFVALAVQLQVTLAACLALFGDSTDSFRWLVGGLLLVGVLAIWWGGVEAAVRAGISDSKRRAAMHLLLLPSTAAAMIGVDFALAMLGRFGYHFVEFGLQDPAMLMLLPSIVVVPASIMLRLVACWIVADAHLVPASSNKPAHEPT